MIFLRDGDKACLLPPLSVSVHAHDEWRFFVKMCFGNESVGFYSFGNDKGVILNCVLDVLRLLVKDIDVKDLSRLVQDSLQDKY